VECFELELVISCDGCRIGLPVNGFAERVTCYHCAAVTTLGVDFWKKPFEDDRLDQARRAPGVGQRVRWPFVHGADFRFALRAPRCLACTAPLDPRALLDVAEAGGDRCFCSACGKPIRLREADAMARSVCPPARAVAHETTLAGESDALERRTEPVVFACMKCGAGLDADGTARSVACKFCGVPNYLPDGLWRQLRPVPVAHPWFLILEGRRSR
jgi:hypothetical protein